MGEDFQDIFREIEVKFLYEFYLLAADCLNLSFLRKQESKTFKPVLGAILSSVFNCDWYYEVRMGFAYKKTVLFEKIVQIGRR